MVFRVPGRWSAPATAGLLLAALALTGCTSLVGAHLVGGGVGGKVWAFDVAPGDCLLTPPPPESEGGLSSMVNAVPCNRPHGVEIYATYTLRDQPYEPVFLGAQASKTCSAALGYRPLHTPADPSTLSVNAYIPGRNSWTEFGIRTFVCYIASLDGTSLQLAPASAG
jgi:hypothetical protein